MVQGNCTQNLDQIFAQLLFRRDHFHSCSLISLFKISYYNSEQHPPPPLAVHSIKLIIDTTQFFPFEGGPSSVRGSHTPNLVQIFKGLVTLYAFSPFPVYYSTHHCAMSYSASFRPNMVVPFHRWTNCGPRQLHSEFGPNIRTTSIPAGPLLLMFSYFTIQNFRLQFDPPPFAVHSIK